MIGILHISHEPCAGNVKQEAREKSQVTQAVVKSPLKASENTKDY